MWSSGETTLPGNSFAPARPRRVGLRPGPPGTRRPAVFHLGHVLGHTVAVRHPLAEHRRHTRAGRDDACEVERIAGREPEELPARGVPAHRAKSVEGFGQGELLTDEAAHDAPAAQLAPHLQATVDAQQIPPGRRAGLSLQEIAEYDAVALRVLPRSEERRVGKECRSRWSPY